MILDPETDDYYDYPDDPDNEIIPTGVSMETRLQRPFKHMDTNVITLCLDSEGVKGVTSEWGFAWIDNTQMVDIAPGPRDINWWPYIFIQRWRCVITRKESMALPLSGVLLGSSLASAQHCTRPTGHQLVALYMCFDCEWVNGVTTDWGPT